jgi:hypothetical protein
MRSTTMLLMIIFVMLLASVFATATPSDHAQPEDSATWGPSAPLTTNHQETHTADRIRFAYSVISPDRIDPRLARCWQHQTQGIWLACSRAGVLWLKYQTPVATRLLQVVPVRNEQTQRQTAMTSEANFAVVLAQRVADDAAAIPATSATNSLPTPASSAATAPAPSSATRWWWHDGARLFHIDERCVWSMLQATARSLPQSLNKQHLACAIAQPQILPWLPAGFAWQPIVTVSSTGDLGQPAWISLLAIDPNTQQQPFALPQRSQAGVSSAAASELAATTSSHLAPASMQATATYSSAHMSVNAITNTAQADGAWTPPLATRTAIAIWQSQPQNPGAVWQHLHFDIPSAMRPNAGPWLQSSSGADAVSAAPWFYLLDWQGLVLHMMPEHRSTSLGPASMAYHSRLVADMRQLHAYVWPSVQVFRHQHMASAFAADGQAAIAVSDPARAINTSVSSIADAGPVQRPVQPHAARHLSFNSDVATNASHHDQLVLQASPLRPLSETMPWPPVNAAQGESATQSKPVEQLPNTTNEVTPHRHAAPRYGAGHYLLSLDIRPTSSAIVLDDLQSAAHLHDLTPAPVRDTAMASAGWYSFQAMPPLQAPFVIAGVLYQPLQDASVPDAAVRFVLMARHLYLGAAIYVSRITSEQDALSPQSSAAHAADAQWPVSQAFFRPSFLAGGSEPVRTQDPSVLQYWASGQWQLKALPLQQANTLMISNTLSTPDDDDLISRSDGFQHRNAPYIRVQKAMHHSTSDPHTGPARSHGVGLFYQVAAGELTPAPAVIKDLKAISSQCPACSMSLAQAMPDVSWQRLATYMFEMEDF